MLLPSEIKRKPVCVDLDGTLIKNDLTAWSIKMFVRRNFFRVFELVFWFFLKGLAQTKRKVAEVVHLEDLSIVQYNKEFVDYLASLRRSGVRLFLATASDEIYAKKVAKDTGIFEGVFASNGEVNLVGKTKADALCLTFGERGFVYAGNSKDDVAVWDRSGGAILVNPSKAALTEMSGRNYLLFEC